MIPRYALPPMAELWTDEAKYRRWLQVELAVLEAQVELGRAPHEALEAIRTEAQAALDLERIASLERETKHDVLAFVRAVEEAVGQQGRWLHWGLTASDVVDTANALALRQGLSLILSELDSLRHLVKERALEHKHTLMVGRTHGMHAEPITFGLKLLNWHAQLGRDRERLAQARQIVSVGKLSGSVGTYAHLDPEVERLACEALGLTPAEVSNQIVQRDRYAQALSALAILGTTIERMALEIRHLARPEIGEVSVGAGDAHPSSSMPHKKNPVAAETLCGLARLLRANLQAELESVATWHERDISHSSVERVVLPDSFLLGHYLVVRMRELLERLEVYPERMRENLELTRGLVSSQAVLLALIEKGLSRAQAHERIARLAQEVERRGVPFKEVLLADEVIAQHLSAEEIESLLDPAYHLKHVETVFQRFSQSDRTRK